MEEADEALDLAYAQALQSGIELLDLESVRKNLLIMAQGDLQNYQDQIKLFRVAMGLDDISPSAPFYPTTLEARTAGWAMVMECDPVGAGMGRQQYDLMFNQLNGVEGNEPMTTQQLRFWSQLQYTNRRAYLRQKVHHIRQNPLQAAGIGYREVGNSLPENPVYDRVYAQTLAQFSPAL